MPPLPCCQPIRWLIAMHRNEKTLTVTHKCATRCDTHSPHRTPMRVFFLTMTDRAHRCQRWHSLSLLLDVCARCTLGNGLCAGRVCIYTISFLRLCICVFSYICMCPCLSLSLSPCPPLAPCPPDSPTVLTLASTYAAGMGQIWAREKMRDGINEGERGHRCQRRRMRVWILSCREHMGVALCSVRQDKESGRLEAKRAIVK